jgi:hypothetical protein
MTFAIMTFTEARQLDYLLCGAHAIKPFPLYCETSDIRMVAGRPAPPGR